MVKWNFDSKKIADKTFEIHLTPLVEIPWHNDSQTILVEGAVSARISFKKNPIVVIEGVKKSVKYLEQDN